MKRCSKCGEEKPVAEFSVDRRAKDGRYSRCKSCHRISAKASYEKHREKKLAWQREYQRKHPERRKKARAKWEAKNPDNLAKRHKTYRGRHKKKLDAEHKAWYEANRNSVLERSARWREENRDAIYARRDMAKHYEYGRKRRAQKLDAYVAPVVEAEIIQRDLGLCGICGEQATGPIELDHTIPLARGGTHEPDNVQLAHRLCNRRKWARTDPL